eukprot:m.302915 g.302915  ORF g.302915 m.302915 type:complete len:694 (-) comp19583_c3_seq2:219-2300(-)
MAANQLKFVQLESSATTDFWHALTQRKLNEFQLSEEAREVHGYFTTGDREGLPARMCISGEAFDSDPRTGLSSHAFCAPGVLHNMNTQENFKKMDVTALNESVVTQIWDDICSGVAIKEPWRLSRFLLVTFANLKKYHFFYWFAFPSFEVKCTSSPPKSIADVFNEADIASIGEQFSGQREASPMTTTMLLKRQADGSLATTSLDNWTEFFADVDERVLVFADPCSSSKYPGWPLRNLLALFAYKLGGGKLTVLCYRERVFAGKADLSRSIVIQTDVPNLEQPESGLPRHFKGWEQNHKKKLAPRVCNLSQSMDPERLAATAVDLNLKLMRWRLMPNIDLPKISGTKCLLFGAGTLGCNVARCLLGWGVRHITLVDNAKVSYSNPVRQSLFEFKDCLEGGSPKAAKAAEHLKQIFPGVSATGLQMTVPMPGHPIGSSELADLPQTVAQLDQLVEEHDVVFLLMDTRESRWLPTVMCVAKRKLCITAAVGFDTYVAMRHGVETPGAPGDRNVGCYFCNDVVAPTNSTVDRSLDQQCTVSRPGLSMLVSGTAVELMVSVLNHDDGVAAMAETSETGACPLGVVPHQVRGALASFGTNSFSGQAFSCCTACSPKVVSELQRDAPALVEQACNSPGFLEELTGLASMRKGVDDLDDLDLDWDSESDDDDQGGEEVANADKAANSTNVAAAVGTGTTV